ncbi:MAG TPA: GAF domain-containing protein, partial [Anaerolineae bacterium]|nr:GAF domain-containing protein [Anaerolineae bacterium]
MLDDVTRKQIAVLHEQPSAIDQLPSALSQMIVPLVSRGQLIGLMYAENHALFGSFAQIDIDLVSAFANQTASAIENARLFQGLEQRVAERTAELNARVDELAIINSVQAGLASKLDLQAIIDLVGDKLRDILNSDDIGIRLYDEQTDRVHYLYEFEHGQRLTVDPMKPSAMFQQQRTDRLPVFGGTAEISRKYKLMMFPGTEQSKALANVPIIAGDKVIGGISVESFEREDFFDESNIRLMQTIASSMGVALENARLFDETQRLLKETDQRAAELALINSVQEGLASKLDFLAIVDLVGDKVCDIFGSQDMSIGLYDRASNFMTMPYFIESGKRYPIEPTMLTPGFSAHVIRTRQPLIINEDQSRRAQELGARMIGDTDPAASAPIDEQSYLGVPILRGDEAIGILTLYENHKHAFTEAHVNLLQTLASAMSVALENARLFDETNQRAAELALINSVQEGLASKLDVQSIYDLIGDKIRDIFDAQAVSIATYDLEKNLRTYRYVIEKGQRYYPEPSALTPISHYFIRSRQPLLINRDYVQAMAALGLPSVAIPGTEMTMSSITVPLLVGGEVKGVIALDNVDREDAFSESDLRLLETLASSMSVALENARLFDETNQRAAELALINSVQEGLASKLDVQAIYDLVGDKIHDLFDAQFVMITAYDVAHNTMSTSYGIEDNKRYYPPPIVLTDISHYLIRTRETLLVNENWAQRMAELGIQPRIAGRTDRWPKSMVFVPLMVGGEVKGSFSLQNMDRENAFSESDVRLLETLASSMSVALENARLFDET